mmetsp:Transcript_10352/g.34260  ORF Transcript_10352/g.34260 Transcript_10352/m.34260 type:complete len:301 (+) Transcript_10352:473-1375(+)
MCANALEARFDSRPSRTNKALRAPIIPGIHSERDEEPERGLFRRGIEEGKVAAVAGLHLLRLRAPQRANGVVGRPLHRHLHAADVDNEDRRDVIHALAVAEGAVVLGVGPEQPPHLRHALFLAFAHGSSAGIVDARVEEGVARERPAEVALDDLVDRVRRGLARRRGAELGVRLTALQSLVLELADGQARERARLDREADQLGPDGSPPRPRHALADASFQRGPEARVLAHAVEAFARRHFGPLGVALFVRRLQRIQPPARLRQRRPLQLVEVEAPGVALGRRRPRHFAAIGETQTRPAR